MKKTLYFLILYLIFYINNIEARQNIKHLKLLKVLPVEGPADNQPSGLTIWNDTLYTVSDKHDSTIFIVNIFSYIIFL